MAGYVRNELRSTSKCRLVLNLHVQVRLAAVAGVAHAGDLLAATNVGARRDARAGALEVREHQVAPGSEPHHEVVAGGVVRVGLADRQIWQRAGDDGDAAVRGSDDRRAEGRIGA